MNVTQRKTWLWVLGMVLTTGGAAKAQEEDEEGATGSGNYGQEGQLEVGGSLDGSWESSEFTLGLSPQIGYFIRERVELSLIASLDYENVEATGGGRVSDLSGSLVLEPSYHFPTSKLSAAFAGLGIGLAFPGDGVAFDLVPRVGVNLEFGRSGVLSPFVSVPMIFWAEDEPGSTVSVSLEFGVALTGTL